MSEKTPMAAPRQVLLEEVRERLRARLVAVEKRMQLLQHEVESLALERIELQAELRVLEEQLQQDDSEGRD